jgi:mannose-6-phosphate isomerase-like protein (cupin superfamily)
MNHPEFALATGEGRSLWVLGDLYTIKLSEDALSVTEVTVFPRNGPPPHIHEQEDESFWVVDGHLSIVLGDQRFRAEAGAFVHIPRGTLHTYHNDGLIPGKLIVMLTPGGFERFWEEVGEPAKQLTIPPAVDPSVTDKLAAVASKYHLVIPSLMQTK